MASVLPLELPEASPGVASRWWTALVELAKSKSHALPELPEALDGQSVLAHADELSVPAELQCRATAQLLDLEFLDNLAKGTCCQDSCSSFRLRLLGGTRPWSSIPAAATSSW
jgi:hypothetical protein